MDTTQQTPAPYSKLSAERTGVNIALTCADGRLPRGRRPLPPNFFGKPQVRAPHMGHLCRKMPAHRGGSHNRRSERFLPPNRQQTPRREQQMTTPGEVIRPIDQARAARLSLAIYDDDQARAAAIINEISADGSWLLVIAVLVQNGINAMMMEPLSRDGVRQVFERVVLDAQLAEEDHDGKEHH